MAGRGRSRGAEAEQEQADEAGLTSDRRPGGADRCEAEASCRRRYESGGRRSTVSRTKRCTGGEEEEEQQGAATMLDHCTMSCLGLGFGRVKGC
jgi:hypothetical protein